MTNIMIRYDPQLIFDPKISATNGDLKLILNGASFESDPQIHLRLLYILYNVIEIKPSTVETSELIIDYLMNIYNFRYVLTMEEEYAFPIQPCSIATSAQKSHMEGGLLNPAQRTEKDDQADDVSINSRAVPLQQSEKYIEKINRQKSSSSNIRDTVEEEESKVNTEEYNESNPFYFENDEFQLRKIDGLRMSLCMSIIILDRLSSVNRRANCTQIFNSKFDKFEALFDYFHPLVNLNNNKCNNFVMCVLEIIHRGAEIGKLEDIILQKDTVKHLIGLLKVALDKNLEDMILLILKTFKRLSNEPRFHNDLLMQDSTSLLNSGKLRDSDNEQIKTNAKDIFDNVIKNNTEKYNMTIQYNSEDLKMIKGVTVKKQIYFLKKFEEALQQNKVNFDQLNDADIENLIGVCKFDNYNENMAIEESFDRYGDSSREQSDEKKEESESEDESLKGDVLQQKMIVALSTMKSLAKLKHEKIRRKMKIYLISQIDTHMRLQKLSAKHKCVILELYLEFFKNSYDLVKDNTKMIDMMFVLSKSILSDKEIASKDIKNVVDFCTFVLKQSEETSIFEKVTE